MPVKIIKNSDREIKKVSHQKNLTKSVIINNGEVNHLLQFATAKFAKSSIVKKHTHESMNEIFLVKNGSLKLITDEDENILLGDDSFVIYKNTPHELVFLEDTELVYFNLEE